ETFLRKTDPFREDLLCSFAYHSLCGDAAMCDRKMDLLVDQTVIEAGACGIFTCAGENDAIGTGPINGTQAHGAGFATAIDRATQELVIADRVACITDGDHLGMCGGIVGREHFVVALPDHPAVLYDHTAERAAFTTQHTGTGQGDGLAQKPLIGPVVHSRLCSHMPCSMISTQWRSGSRK